MNLPLANLICPHRKMIEIIFIVQGLVFLFVFSLSAGVIYNATRRAPAP